MRRLFPFLLLALCLPLRAQTPTPPVPAPTPTLTFAFDGASSATETELRAALALYPPCLMMPAKPEQFTVYVAPDARAWDGLCQRFGLPRDEGDWVVDGVTIPARRVVCLRLSSGDGSDLRQVWLHELYHVISQTVLTRAERGAWKQVWLRERKQRRLVSEYAGTNDEEGAAEFVSTELLHPAETGPAHPQALAWWTATVADHALEKQ